MSSSDANTDSDSDFEMQTDNDSCDSEEEFSCSDEDEISRCKRTMTLVIPKKNFPVLMKTKRLRLVNLASGELSLTHFQIQEILLFTKKSLNMIFTRLSI
ncbi:hypothetical protein QE152_g36654 [Popillia japonica]|uniref:Uncharacterized protein n=1 Tax=Popillia japonica TaxID=7064 RepID=A0AAW1ICW4_POPJA